MGNSLCRWWIGWARPAFGACAPLLVVAVVLMGAGLARADGERYAVSILPLQGLLSELAGPGSTVDVLVGPGETPETYEPTARQLVALARTQALFVIGVPFETALVPRLRRQLPSLRIVDVGEGIEDLAADPAHGHAHEVDPHLWTDPHKLIRIVHAMADVVMEFEPAQAGAIAARLDAIVLRLETLDRELEESLRAIGSRVIAVYHPAFGHFGARYGFEQLAIESGGLDAGARHVVELSERMRTEGVRALFVQPQFSPQRARTLASMLDVEIVEIDPLDQDVEGMLRSLASALGAAAPELAP